jgi:hypothetical protein
MDELKKHPMVKPERPKYKIQKTDDEIRKAEAEGQTGGAKPTAAASTTGTQPAEAAKKP